VGRLAALGVANSPTLLVVGQFGGLVSRAGRNVPWLTIETPTHVSVYQLVRAEHVVFERGSLQALEEALAR
jgi:ribosomal protein L4